MPDTSTIEDVNEALAAIALEPASASADGQSATNRSADDILKLRDAAAAQAALSSGGSMWGKTRMAKAKFPGGGSH